MSIYSRYAEKGLIYITIIALLGRQPFLYTKYTKLNIRSSYVTNLVLLVLQLLRENP